MSEDIEMKIPGHTSVKNFLRYCEARSKSAKPTFPRKYEKLYIQ